MNSSEGNEFLRELVRIIIDEQKIVGNPDFIKQNHPKLLDFKYPEELEKILDLSVGEEEESNSKLLDICRQIIQYSVKTCNPNFYNQLYGGTEQFALAGSWLTDALNTSIATWEISPVFAVMEKYLIKYLGKMIGYNEPNIDGMFCPGGSNANTYGMVLARHKAFPEIKTRGIRHLGPLVMFASEESHYSFDKSSIWLGMGSLSVIKVKADQKGRMIPEELRISILKAKEQGMIPYMVGATSGTTVLGAFDPLPQIGDICEEFGLWFHVDAALGGVWLLSRKHRHLLDGVERADSVAWDLHKTTSVPQQCSLVLTKHPKILFESNSLKAEYIFQSDKYYDSSYDSGDKSIQCGRRVDSLKLWLALKAYGQYGLEKAIDNVYDMAEYLTQKVRERPGFQLVLEQFQSNLVSFWYIPPKMRKNGVTLKPEVLSKIAPIIKKRMMETGSLMIGYQPLSTKGLPNFFRVSIACFPERNQKDMDYILDQIEKLAENIEI